MKILYDLGLMLGLIASLPRIIWKRKLGIFWQRFISQPPSSGGRSVIWIHAVSVGEAKSAKGLLSKIKEKYPQAFVLLTTATGPGLEEAKRSLKLADAHCFMPFDFSFVMRRWTKNLQPKLLILVESDFWIQHLHYVKRCGGQIVLVSGKMSERSASRFLRVPFITEKLFCHFDHVLVQNEEYFSRFSTILNSQINLHIGGNLKLNAVPDKENLLKRPKTGKNEFAMAVISTHAPEEDELLTALKDVSGTIYLAPRHPERFSLVAKMLEASQISFGLWSEGQEKFCAKRVVLVDAMGQIPNVCALCDVAIVAGSFSSKVGGHNIAEPSLYGLPVFFGPHMHKQKELVERVLKANAGKQVEAAELAMEISHFRDDSRALKNGAISLVQQEGKALETTWNVVSSLLKNHKAW